eukprot:TRINITY_DN13190_c0_g1_i2.p1 TRINITY_DN13190_c0_g1~~TRINITY_DN13190_c0_g1_i2.p1  ORF type:complete len:154 (+),score=23.84 TRINITY_DN13190_c0_g1_i2:93-554(+)
MASTGPLSTATFAVGSSARSTGSFSARKRQPSPKAKTFLVPKSQCMLARPTDTVWDVMTAFVSINFKRRRCYVLDERGCCLGMVGLGQVVKLWHDGGDSRATQLGDIMLRDFAHCGEQSTLDDCAEAVTLRQPSPSRTAAEASWGARVCTTWW